MKRRLSSRLGKIFVPRNEIGSCSAPWPTEIRESKMPRIAIHLAGRPLIKRSNRNRPGDTANIAERENSFSFPADDAARNKVTAPREDVYRNWLDEK